MRTREGARNVTDKQSDRVAQISCTLTTDSDSPADSLIRRLIDSDLQANSHVRRVVMYARLGRRCSSPRPAGLEQYAWTRAWIGTGARAFALGAREPAWRRDCSATVCRAHRDSVKRETVSRRRGGGGCGDDSAAAAAAATIAAAAAAAAAKQQHTWQQPMPRRQYHAYPAVPPGYSY